MSLLLLFCAVLLSHLNPLQSFRLEPFKCRQAAWGGRGRFSAAHRVETEFVETAFQSKETEDTADAMQKEAPLLGDLVLIGGGHAHVHVLKMLAMKPLAGCQVTLISRDVETPYSGMLPGFIAGHYTKEQCHIDLVPLARLGRVRFLHTEAVKLDLHKKEVHCADGRPPVRFDFLSIDIGSTPSFPRSENPKNETEKSVEETAVVPVKPIDSLSSRFETFLDRLLGRRGGKASLPSEGVDVLVVGGGAAGVEMALAIQHRLNVELDALDRGAEKERLRFRLLNRGESVLSSHNRYVQRTFSEVLKERGIAVETRCDVVGIQKGRKDEKKRKKKEGVGNLNGETGGRATCADGRVFEFDECFWCTHAAAQHWLNESGLAVDDEGFVRTDVCLRSVSHPEVFAAGDCASMDGHPRPKAGVFAVRAGPPLVENLRRAFRGQPLVTYTPQSSFLGLISTGDKHAVASRGSFVCLRGDWLWTVKDYIDRTWMAKYSSELPDVETMMKQMQKESAKRGAREESEASLEETVNHLTKGRKSAEAEEAIALLRSAGMRCGGCGSKVGEGALRSALRGLNIPSRSEVEVGVGGGEGDDAAVLSVPSDFNPSSDRLVQTVDFFRSPVTDPFVFGKIAAIHAMSDAFAMGCSPFAALALVTVPAAREAVLVSSLRAVMAGCCEALRAHDCALVGGHTSEGKGEGDFGLGLSLTAVGRKDEVLLKGGMRKGDKLILTKAVGTGVVLAADMRARARGPWVKAAVDSMCASNWGAARILKERGRARACTDVTGFGVAGHLIEMLRASNRVREGSESAGQPGGRVTARIRLESLPCLPGAIECVEKGIFSSLAPANQRLSLAMRQSFPPGGGVAEGGAAEEAERRNLQTRWSLLFDPQTSGGLLASVPTENVEKCLEALREGGYKQAACIGEVAGDLSESTSSGEGGGECSQVLIDCTR